MSDQQIILSPGWSHYVVSAPLSPKALGVITRRLKEFQAQNAELESFSREALTLPILDLGVLPESLEPRLVKLLKRGLAPYASQEIHARSWSVEPLSAARGALWLTWEDRLGELDMMRAELSRMLTAELGALTEVRPVTPTLTPNQAGGQSSAHKKSWGVLCGSLSRYDLDTYKRQIKCSAWLNHIELKKRPQRFDPVMGYHNVWRHALPLETPPLIELEHSPQIQSHISTHANPTQRARSRSDLSGRSLELFELLEERLKTIEPVEIVPPTPRAHSSRRRRRRPRA